MPRRASSSVNPLWIVAAVVIILGLIVGAYFLYQVVGDPYRTLAPLEIKTYLDNSNSLRGNIYKLDGTIANQLAWSPKTGRLFSLDVESSSGGEVLPLLIPPELNHVNIQKGQHFHFKIEVGENGILKVQDLRKV